MEEARCSHCGAPLRAGDKFCPSCGAPRRAAPAGPSASLQVTDDADADLAEQRKVVTVVFADLTGSTPLAERLDPEEMRGILGSYFNVLARQIQRYEGTIDKYIGDAVMAVFGAPMSHEDDAERAISAALAMQGSIAKLNDDLDARYGVRLALRIGINTGEVVAGLLAGEVQNAYTVVGDTVNTAQRFEAAAPPGQILVSRTTRQLAIHSFEFEAVEPLVLKGKSHPVEAWRVAGRRYEEIEPEATPFIGRTRELDLLRAAAVQAILGKGGVYHLSGEAGVGKSRIVGELRANLVAGVDRLTVRCASFERNVPYALIGDVIRGAFRMRASDDERTARLAIVAGLEGLGRPPEGLHVALLLDILGYAVEARFEPEKKRSVLLHLLRELLRGQSQRAAFVITAEDLHWCDDASVAVLRDLVGDVASLPCLFISTARPEWTPPWQAQHMRLDPLAGDEAKALVQAAFGVPAEADLVTSILARTGGNPFFTEEVARSLQASDVLVERTGRVGLREGAIVGVPATVQEMLEARIDRLPPGPRAAIAPAAVIGRTFAYRVLERVTRRRSLPDDVGRLEDESLVAVRTTSPELVYAFRQALIQEVAYQTQLLATRRATHARVAEAISDLNAERLDELVDVLAYHYARSDEPARAVGWLVRAGDRARRLYANDEAVRSYAEALSLGAAGDQRRGALEGLADVHGTLGHPEQAREGYTEAIAMSGDDPAVRARLQRKVGFTYMRAGEYSSASEWQRRALETIGARPSAEVAPVWLDIGQMAWRQARFDEAISACERGIAAAQRAETPSSVADGHRHLGTALVLKGDRDAAALHYARALDLYTELGDPFGVMAVRNNFGVLYRRMDRWADALREQEAALEIARRIGDAWSVGTILSNNGEALRYQGRLDEALAAYEEALRIWTQAGDAAGVALQHMNIGILEAERGDLAGARRALLRSLEEFEAVGSKRFVPELLRTLARVELPGDPAAARERARRALAVAREIAARDEEAMALQILGRSQAALGETAAAEAAELFGAIGARQEREKAEALAV